MNFKLIKKWFFRVVLAQIALSIVALIWVDYQIDDMWGAHTSVVDHAKFKTAQTRIAIENVNTLSTDGTRMLSNQTVVIDNGKIQSIGSNITVPSDSLIVDGEGKYLIPGLIDSHVHLWQSPNDLLLYLANGVTHVRELNGSQDHLRWREEIKNGRIGPRLFVASRRLNSNNYLKGLLDGWTAKTSSIGASEQAEATLSSFENQRYDAVKIYSFLSKEHFSSLNDAAGKVNIPMLGHIHIAVELGEIWNSTLKELAHIEEIVKALDREFGGFSEDSADEYLEFVHARSQEVAAKLSENHMAVVTTLWLSESFERQRHDLDSALGEAELAYVNPGITELSPLASRVMGWLPNSNIYRISQDHSHEVLAGDKLYWNTYAKAHQILLRAMVKEGVTLMAGTDANVPTAVPGFSMHDELQSLTKAGMTPSQALLSATAVPASWMNVKSGKIAQGYNADLVLLDANPLADIGNTTTINSVVSNGQFLSRRQLNEMLSAVKKANDQDRKTNIDAFR